MTSPQFAYICGPYRSHSWGGIDRNIERAKCYAMRYWSLGYYVICPHTNSGHFDKVCPDEFFLSAYKELLRRDLIDLLVVLPGYEQSPGSLDEIHLAQRRGIKIEFADKTTTTLP